MKWITSTPCGCIDVYDDGITLPDVVFVAEDDDTILLGAEMPDIILGP